MRPSCAGLALHVDRADADLARLRVALDRSLKDCPEPRFATLFIDAPHGADPRAMAELRSLLICQDRLTSDAEITWHGPTLSEDASATMGVTRRSAIWTEVRGDAQVEAIDLSAGDLRRSSAARWFAHLREHGVVHLGLRPGRGFSLNLLRQFDAAACDRGFVRYEAVNWARPGSEAAWLIHARQGGPIMGIGSGMYGRWPFVFGWQWWRGPRPHRWRRMVEEGQDGRGRLHLLHPEERAIERLIDGLRLFQGVDLAEIEAETGCLRTVWLDEAALARLLDRGDLTLVGHDLRVPDLNHVDMLAEMLLPRARHSAARA
jgi:hypothetical protein